MLIGVPRESKDQEHRVGLTPAGARELITAGHRVIVQEGAGAAIGMSDQEYQRAGASVAVSAQEVFAQAELVVKVKELQPAERGWLRPGQVLFAYLHLAPDPDQAQALLASDAIAIAYETVTGPGGRLPLLAPMSEVAGRMAVQVGAAWLEMPRGGRGVLLAGVPGVERGHVVVLGSGTVAANAVQMAVGLGAAVTVVGRNLEQLRGLDRLYGNRVATRASGLQAVEEAVLAADVVIGAVLVPGAEAPRLVSRDMVARMKPGSVIVDVSIDQGGCFETSRPTSHSHPTFVEHGVTHYCVTNMPGAVARTSTLALTQATLPFVRAIADLGWQGAVARDAHLRAGLNICRGEVTSKAVADALGYAWRDPDTVYA